LKFLDTSDTQQRIIGNLSTYTVQKAYHVYAKYYFPVEDNKFHLGPVAPPTDIILKLCPVSSTLEVMNLCTQFSPSMTIAIHQAQEVSS
jgi:hypothetical protein